MQRPNVESLTPFTDKLIATAMCIIEIGVGTVLNMEQSPNAKEYIASKIWLPRTPVLGTAAKGQSVLGGQRSMRIN